MKPPLQAITPKWYPFLKLLLKEGRYQWKTPDQNDVSPLIISTLYLDGDLHCNIVDQKGVIPDTLSTQIADAHLRKMTADLASLQKFASRIAYFLAAFLLSAVWAFNFEDYLKSLIFTGIFVPLAYYFKKLAIRHIISMVFSFLKVRFKIQEMF